MNVGFVGAGGVEQALELQEMRKKKENEREGYQEISESSDDTRRQVTCFGIDVTDFVEGMRQCIPVCCVSSDSEFDS